MVNGNGGTVIVEQVWWYSTGETVMVEQWNRDGGTLMVKK